MPYADPARKRAWDKKHRPERFARIKEATEWADEQVNTLKEMGTKHTAVQWRELRSEFRRSYLKNPIPKDAWKKHWKAAGTDPQLSRRPSTDRVGG